MERTTTNTNTNTPVRNPHTSTADLLTWSETPLQSSSVTPIRTHQPSDGISKVVFGGQITDEEADSLMKRKPCSGYKMKEMTGSGIFIGDGENGAAEDGSASQTPSKTGLRYQQAVAGISQISFSEKESVSPKKPTSLPEVAKQRELSGTLQSEADAKMKKQPSDAKWKELSGHDIFGPPPEIQPRPLDARALENKGTIDAGEPAPRNLRTSVKISKPVGGESNPLFSEEVPLKTTKKIHNQKFQELTGNDIFKGETPPPGSTEKSLSSAKLKEMSGSDIFADGKAPSREFLGARKPPGGESSIALV